MVELNHRDRTIKVKLVYYGPPVGGKTTNLQILHRAAAAKRRGDKVGADELRRQMRTLKTVRQNLDKLPDDYDPAYALSSPTDQRLATPLVGGERVELVNMTPSGRLVIELPRISLAFTSCFGLRREPHPTKLTTVLIEPEEHRLSLVWQSTLRVPAPEADYLDGTEIVENRGAA